MSLKQLQNKTVWILGASSGIGKELALVCAYCHARVLLTDSSFSSVQRTLAQVQKISSSCRIVSADFTRSENIAETVEHVIDKYGPVYMLIDNMGISGKKLFLDISGDQFSEIINHRVKALTLMIQSLLPSMIEDGGGRIAFTGNVGGLYSGRGSSVNSVVQYSLEGLFRSIRAEHGKDKISLSIVSPVSIAPAAGNGDSVRNSLVYRGEYNKKYLIMDSRKCALIYLIRVLRGQKRICINHKFRPILLLLRKTVPSLFEIFTGMGFY